MDSSNLFHELEALSPYDQELFWRYGRGLSVDVPYYLVHHAFESIVDSDPSTIAARKEGKAITYGELEDAANKMANHLIELGLTPKQRVCLVVQRSFEMLVGILAILKAGCQYVPIDGAVSSDHALSHVFKDTGARFVLCLPKFEERVKLHVQKDTHIVCLGTDAELFALCERPRADVSSEDGVYAIYTSGSTGKPKGVDVKHGNVTNALLLEPARLGISKGSRVAQVLNIAFDMGAWEILACLMNGGTLYIRGSKWEETLKEVNTLISTPSILSKFRKAHYPNIKTVVTGGEPCPQPLADEWAANTTYYNICGPTEITILNSAHKHEPGQKLSIGKPLPNTNVYILDESENPVPVGSTGSMWVGGAGVTRGYINLPELTSRKYKLDKFSRDGSMMFNTGDLVCWKGDGSLETLGRADDQVKIKGFRVELDGVSAVIEKFPGILRATALMIDGTLYGFYITTTLIDEQDLAAFVSCHLPYYSVPERWCYVPDIPLTPNGKINKVQLTKVALRATRTISTLTTKTFTSKELYHPAVTINVDEVSSPSSTESIPVVKSSALSTFNLSNTSVNEKPETLPLKNGFHGERWLRHRLFILYRRFFTVVILSNIACACYILYRRVEGLKPMLADLATATAVNLCVAVLMRSEPVINLLFTVFCSAPTCWPLAIRKHFARVFHIGGIHSGCAIAATMWFAIFTVGASLDLGKPPAQRCMSLKSLILTYMICLLLLSICTMAHPTIRIKIHNAFELVHRYCGWSALILLWIQAVFVTLDLRVHKSPSQALRTSPPIYLLAIATAAIIFPWLHLKKVPVRSEVLSNHAIRLHFDYTTPMVGSSVRLAERPLVDWHGFATITNANGKGFSLVVSNAGDFTKRTINRAPSKIWVRGIPAAGVLRICTLFKSVVLVATGSGIGPCLAVILAKKTPCRILWTAPHPEQTFGKEIVDAVMDTDPKAVIHNTRTMGKPDMSLMAYRLWKESGAEAVCVISNKKFTTKIVYDMEARGIPSYGAIFDS